jgi:hypothetical protein
MDYADNLIAVWNPLFPATRQPSALTVQIKVLHGDLSYGRGNSRDPIYFVRDATDDHEHLIDSL